MEIISITLSVPLILGTIMVLDSFGVLIPEWLSPVVTIGVIGYFFYKSRQCL